MNVRELISRCPPSFTAMVEPTAKARGLVWNPVPERQSKKGGKGALHGEVGGRERLTGRVLHRTITQQVTNEGVGRFRFSDPEPY